MQRVYGITFPDKESLKDYQYRMEEAKRRDHRNVGTQMELFFFNPLSPGSAFFLPNGTRIYNTLIEVDARTCRCEWSYWRSSELWPWMQLFIPEAVQ